MHLVEKDLLSYGVPLTLQVPDSAEITLTEWGLQKDITIVDAKSGYNLQVFNSKALTHNLEKLKENQRALVEEGPYFSKIITDEADGFVFELKVDSTINYDFRHFKIQGDQEYLFQGGLMSRYSLEEAQKIYAIAKAAK